MNPGPGFDPLVGRRVAHYQISARLGAGGMGVVYKATDEKLGRAVALKFLPPEIGEGPEKRRFLQEARAASALDHPNICVIHSIEETAEGQTFIVMAFHDGETLSEKIRRRALRESQAADIVVQIAHGLAEAHAHGIIHRDIKPANVIVTSSGVAKILDFGLAKMDNGETQTRTGAVVGTPSYMSPEQALGRGVDLRTDIWSTGVVLYELVTGTRPFVRDSTPSTLLAITADPPTAMTGVSERMQAVIYRCLAKEPDRRYGNARELAADLDQLRTGSAAWSPTMTMDGAEVRQAIEAASTQATGLRPAGTPPPDLEARGRRRKKRGRASTAIGMLFVAASWLGYTRVHRGNLVPEEKHIAVLPFTNIGGDPSVAAICDGMLETLTSRLSTLEQGESWIVPASEVRRRGVADAETARRVFKANMVITGAVQKDSGGVRLTVNLIDTKTLRQLGSSVLDDKLGDFAALQDNAVSSILKMLKVEAHPGAGKAAGESATPAAYESYLKGIGFLQRYDKPGNLDMAIQLLNDAITRDPRFALGFARLAEAERLKYRESRAQPVLDLAVTHAKHAVELDDQLAPVHVTLGQIHSETGKYDLAVEEFQRALKLDPRNAEAYERTAGTFQAMGRFDEAEKNFKTAIALRPNDWSGHNALGAFYYNRGRYSEAAAQFRTVIDLTPDNATAYLNLGVMLGRLNDTAGARDAFQKSIQIAPSYAAYSNLAGNLFNGGDYAGAAATYEKAIQLNDRTYRPWAGLALAYRGAGAMDKAKPALERAIALAESEAANKPNDAVIQGDLASYYAKEGNAAKARTHIATALALAPQDQRTSYMACLTFEALSDRAAALKWLKTAIAQGYSLSSIQQDPELRALRSDPAFAALIR